MRLRPLTTHVVFHSTRSGRAEWDGEFDATLAWFANRVSKVSAHYVVDRKGRIARVVPLDLIAWHVGLAPVTDGGLNWNHRTIGVEMVQGTPLEAFTEFQYDALTELVLPEIKAQYGQLEIVGHDELDPGNSDPGPLWNWSRVRDT